MLRIVLLMLCVSGQALRLLPKMENSKDGAAKCLTCTNNNNLNPKELHTVNLPKGCGPQSSEIEDMWNKMKTLHPVSDKFTDHTYQTMYGIFLMPWRTSEKGPKLLEIGLGCNMGYGPGASVQAWQTLIPTVELWEAEYDAACVRKSRRDGTLKDDVHTVTGDQGDAAVVDQWVNQSGGKYDIVIDDGGHKNTQIKTSFDHLWPHVNPGGLYFLEDLQVGREANFEDTNQQAVMSDILQAWTDQLLISSPRYARRNKKKGLAESKGANKFPLPKDVDFIFCQHEACVIGKTKRNFKGKEWE